MSTDQLIKTILLPLALILIMFGMGMTLRPVDFIRVVKKPKAKVVGLLCQLILLPLSALGLVLAFGLTRELAVGMMLIAACPGGATSNMISHLSRGDTALSVTLTAVSSVVTVFTIPLIVGTSLQAFLGAETEIPFRFTQRPGLADLARVVETSSDLADWTAVDAAGVDFLGETPGGDETWEARVPFGDHRGFLRLKALNPPAPP